MTRLVLTLNGGSSGLKFALFNLVGKAGSTVRGEVLGLAAEPHLLARDVTGAVILERHWPGSMADPIGTVLVALLNWIEVLPGASDLAAIGHRIVQGGADHVRPEVVTSALMQALAALTPLDPLHMPDSLGLMRAVAAARPALVQVACFDTAFHHTLPAVATRFALPRVVTEAGVRRYGFHGLSYEYIADHLARDASALMRGRVIVAHLGSGASLCALQGGRSIATTTGFTALDGVVMATRCGTIDPGVILYLGSQGYGFAEIEDMLYRRSGLLGVSGISGDVRVLLASDDPHAQDAVELFTYRIAVEAGGLASALGGLDGLVFTGGVGEHAPAIRAEVCGRLAWLGLRLDVTANAAGAARIGAADSRVDVRVIATDEEAMIAQHTWAIIDRSPLR